jgi:hypothetical protein
LNCQAQKRHLQTTGLALTSRHPGLFADVFVVGFCKVKNNKTIETPQPKTYSLIAMVDSQPLELRQTGVRFGRMFTNFTRTASLQWLFDGFVPFSGSVRAQYLNWIAMAIPITHWESHCYGNSHHVGIDVVVMVLFINTTKQSQLHKTTVLHRTHSMLCVLLLLC